MSIRAYTILLATLGGGVSLLLPPIDMTQGGYGVAWQFSRALAQSESTAGDISEKEAFDSAKELGSIEAWEAFLNAFPTGFRADLARAYVRRLGTNERAPSSAGAENKPVTASRQARLATYAAEPGTSPWRTTRYVMDEGNNSANAAAVRANGIEFLTYCNAYKRMAAVLRETTRGVYPEFDGRIQQGLAANDNFIIVRFSNGTEYPVSAAVQGLTGDVTIGTSTQGKVGFRPNGRILSDMMAGQTMTLFAPPFSATLQLKNSRAAICKVVNQCGAGVPGCTRLSRKAVSKTKKKRTTARKRKSKIEKNAARNCAELGMAYRGGQCVPKSRKARTRARKRQNMPCPAGMYRNPYGNCQPNETGG